VVVVSSLSIRRKGQVIGPFAAIVLMIIVAFVIVAVIMKMRAPAANILEFGPGACDDADKQRGIGDFNYSIVLYGSRMREGGDVPNELYAPEDALDNFRTYVACKEAGMFTADEISKYDTKIMYAAKRVYISYAEDICNEFCRADAMDSKEDVKEIGNKHADLIEEYNYVFENEKFAGIGDCTDYCNPASKGSKSNALADDLAKSGADTSGLRK